MISEVQEPDVVELLKHLAGQQTCSEIMFGDKLPVQSVEGRLAEVHRRRVRHDAAVLKARGVLASMGVAQ